MEAVSYTHLIKEQGLEADMIYACGPTPMLRAIKAYAEENEIECYISLEAVSYTHLDVYKRQAANLSDAKKKAEELESKKEAAQSEKDSLSAQLEGILTETAELRCV